MSDPLGTLARMKTTAPLKCLSDEALLFATRELVRRSVATEADLIEHLAEIDERKLYLKTRYPSLFLFCMHEFGFSESAAYKRIGVARAARKFPAILAALRSGKVHLAGLRVLVPLVTAPNCDRLLAQAAGKSRREIEELIARIAPAEAVRTSIRRLPGTAPATLAAQQPSLLASAAAPPMPAPQPSAAAASTAQGARAAQNSAAAQTGTAATPVVPGARRTSMAPLSGEAFKIEFTASRQLRDKLLAAQTLCRNRTGGGGLAKVVEDGTDLLIETVMKERFALGRKPRNPTETEGVVPAAGREGSATRHIPDAIKRFVYQRDGGRCTFRDPQGQRCTSLEPPEFQHDDGFARTGVHDPDRIRLLCPAHNQGDADEMYGREFMDRARRSQQDGKPAQGSGDP